jgi:hypothetical protein
MGLQGQFRDQDRATAQWHFIEYLPSGQRNRICRRGARRGIASQRKSNSKRSGSVKAITTNGSRAAGRPSFVISSIADGESQRPAGQYAVDQASGRGEREAALETVAQLPGSRPVTLGTDKAYDTAAFVRRPWSFPKITHPRAIKAEKLASTSDFSAPC